MRGIAYEAERRPNHCKHVSEPKSPKILYGCQPSEAVRIAAERAKQAVDAKGKRLKIDGLVFLGGVASYPVKWTKIRADKAEAERLRKWLRYLIVHLKEQYAGSLHYVLLHTDEPFPHCHWGCVPELEPDRRMRISTVHPGRAAYERARAAGGDNAAGLQAYSRAMKAWQDAFHVGVYAKVGIERVGPRRQRLTRSEYKAREEAEAALAKTLATEHELKAKWREEIRAQIMGEFSDELAHWKQRCIEQDSQLTAIGKEMAYLRSRLAEFESQIEPPGGGMP